MIFYFCDIKHLPMVERFLASWGRELAGKMTIVPYSAFIAGEVRVPEDGGVYVFSGLQAFAWMQPRARETLAAFHSSLVRRNSPSRVLNEPARSLGRFELLRELHARGMNDFNAYRLSDPYRPMHFPIFIRDEGGTEIRRPPLLRNRIEYEAARLKAWWHNEPAAKKIAVEFCDTADSKGIYRKYGAFIVGERIVPRHLFFSSKWMVKEARIAEPELLAEEMAYLSENPHAKALKRCAEVARISYGRIDYSMLDGRPQVWEINRSPSIAGGSSENVPARQPATEKFVAMFLEAFAALESLPAIAIRKMRTADHARVMEILAQWNMAPIPPSTDVPDPERSSILIDNTFVATADGVLVGVASYILHGEGFAETASLAVDAAWRGRNVGEKLQAARLAEMKSRGVTRVQTEADRPEIIDWYRRKYGYRVVGKNRKRHGFSLTDIDHWTVLELDLDYWQPSA